MKKRLFKKKSRNKSTVKKKQRNKNNNKKEDRDSALYTFFCSRYFCHLSLQKTLCIKTTSLKKSLQKKEN